MTLPRKKLLLIKVPQCEYASTDLDLTTVRNFRPELPLSIGYLAAFTREFGKDDFDVTAIDLNTAARIEAGNQAISQEKMHQDLEAAIRDHDYDVLGVSTVFVNNYRWANDAAKWSKKYHPDAPVIIGGGYPTIMPEKALEMSGADYVVIGEGEDTFFGILNTIFGRKNARFDEHFPGWTGYATRENGHIKLVPKTTFIKNIDMLPFPAWDMLRVDEYLDILPRREMMMMSSRGCPFNCIYCSTHLAWGRGIRFRSSENVLGEVDWLYDSFGVKHVHFMDDNMTANKKRSDEIFNGFIERDRADWTWQASNFAIKSLQRDTVELMLKSKMQKATLAIESGAQHVQKKIGKNLNLERAEEVYRWFEEYDHPLHLNFMIGFPMENMDDIRQTLDFAKKLHAHETQINIVTPWPGTKMYDYAIDNNHLNQHIELDDLDHRKAVGFVNTPWQYEELGEMVYDLNIRLNFLLNRDFDSPKHYDRLLQRFASLENGLPKHAVLQICLGYLHALRGEAERSAEHYAKAMKLYEDKAVQKTYAKYLEWQDVPPVADFLKYRQEAQQ